LGAALVPVDRPGVEIMYNWDGLSMRASGSHDVVFTNYFVTDEEFGDIGEFGKYNGPFLAVASSSSLGLSSIFVGIAESAHEIALNAIKGKQGAAQYAMNQVSQRRSKRDRPRSSASRPGQSILVVR